VAQYITVPSTGEFHGGISNHITVREDDVITEAKAQLFAQRQGPGGFSVIRGDVRGSVAANTSNVGPNSPKALAYKPFEVDCNEEFDTDPSQGLKDPVSLDLIHNAVVTPCGHTFDYHVIEEVIKRDYLCPITRHPLKLNDLIENHAVQDMIGKKTHRISKDVT
jgi:hypothetical protein